MSKFFTEPKTYDFVAETGPLIDANMLIRE